MVIGMSKTELNAEAPETVTGGAPMSIPGGKHSGRRNSEKAAEIANRLGYMGNSIPESLGLKQKPVNNSIVDKRLPEGWYNS